MHQAVPKVIRHVDCQTWYTFMNRYKAIVYLNGDSIQEMFDFSLQELKERLRKRIDEVDATSHTPLTKAVLWTTEPAVWHSAAVHIQAT